jgi:hypothetical protein
MFGDLFASLSITFAWPFVVDGCLIVGDDGERMIQNSDLSSGRPG